VSKLRKGKMSELAKKFASERVSGTARLLEAEEELPSERAREGQDFSRAVKSSKYICALAPAVSSRRGAALSTACYSSLSADSSAFRNSAGSITGGWQAIPEHRTANDSPEFNCGKFGIVAASAGGRFPATA
jgi:hypothetical protein